MPHNKTIYLCEHCGRQSGTVREYQNKIHLLNVSKALCGRASPYDPPELNCTKDVKKVTCRSCVRAMWKVRMK